MDEFVRIFKATIGHPELDVSFDVLAVSGSDFDDHRLDAKTWMRELGIEGRGDLPSRASSIPLHLAALASPAPTVQRTEPASGEVLSETDPRFTRMAEYVAYAPIVPFEGSPLDLKSIGGLVAEAGVGATVGFAAGGPTPLLIVTVPAGIFLVRVARKAGDAAGDVLESHILRLAYKRKKKSAARKGDRDDGQRQGAKRK